MWIEFEIQLKLTDIQSHIIVAYLQDTPLDLCAINITKITTASFSPGTTPCKLLTSVWSQGCCWTRSPQSVSGRTVAFLNLFWTVAFVEMNL